MELQTVLIKVLKAAAGRIVQPADPQPPGDWRADLAWFILQQLHALPSEQAQGFADALQALNTETWAVFGYPFFGLPGSQQDEMLLRVQDASVRTRWDFPPKEFLDLLLKLTDEAARKIEAGHPVDRPQDWPKEASEEELAESEEENSKQENVDGQ